MILIPRSSGAPAWFAGLGDLPGGDYYSSAFAVSADHRVVVGFSVSHGTSDDGREAFIWTREGGMVGLGNLDGIYGTYSGATDVSDDGRVVVGYVGAPDGDIRSFRWTVEEGLVILRDLVHGRDRGEASAVSADGHVIVGSKDSPNGTGWIFGSIAPEAYRWTRETGMIGIGDLKGADFMSLGSGVSSDGSVIVGISDGSDEYYFESYRWTAQHGMKRLGTINPDDIALDANAVSADGETIVGHVADARDVWHAIRWVESTGITPLWPPNTRNSWSEAEDVSGDGSRIVGYFREPGLIHVAFLWDEVSGRRDLKQILIEEHGLGDALGGWKLEAANAISVDGLMIAGRGINPAGQNEAFVAYLGDPVEEETAFLGLGHLAGGVAESAATAVSGDGTTVVGYGYSENGGEPVREAFRWTLNQGMLGLGRQSDGFSYSAASGVSGHGETVVGSGLRSLEVSVGGATQTVAIQRAFSWTSARGMIELNDPTSVLYGTWATSVSADGNKIVGSRETFVPDLHLEFREVEAARWIGSGSTEGLGDLPDGNFSSLARDTSADGSVVVGIGSPLGFGQEAFRWTAAEGMTGLGTLNPGDRVSSAEAVSADGLVVVGYSRDRFGLTRAFRWSQADGMVPLRNGSEGDTQSFAYDVSGDGETIVGWYEKPITFEIAAFVWTREDGFRDLQDVMVDGYGLGNTLAGWTLESARSVSASGTRIVGQGINPSGDREAFLAILPDLVFPSFVSQPVSQAGNLGDPITLSVGANLEDNLAYQWRLDGVDIPGATGSDYTIPMVQRFHAGEYTVMVSNGPARVTSDPATLTAEPPPASASRLLNLSTRALVGGVGSLVLPGFVIEGSGTKRILLRGVGASLRQPPFNMTSALGDPWLMVGTVENFIPNGGVFSSIERNNDLETSENREAVLEASRRVGAFPLIDERDGAILVDLSTGVYTAWISSEGGEYPDGVAIAEIYDVDDARSDSVLVNLSTRGFVGLGSEVLIPGFVVAPEGPLTLLIRVVGPTMGGDPFNVPDVISDPMLSVYGAGSDGVSRLLFSNDDWGNQADAQYTEQIAEQVGAFTLKTGGKDAAIVLTLPPGAYTVVGSSADGEGTGTGLVELYVVP